jgi:release factor glutamine methyltransferase
VKIRDALREGKARLLSADLDLSELEAESLLIHALAKDRVHLYQSLDESISDEQLATYRGLLDRRAAHEPTAYIVGVREFYGMDVRVTPAALIPRPETEALVEAVIAFARERASPPLSIVDVGTGAGGIAIALAANLPEARVIATDQSVEALALARENADRNVVGARIDFRQGDLLEPLDQPVDVIAANLPYVTTNQWKGLPPELRENEPRLALDGGSDGLDLIRRLLRDAPARLAPGGAIFCEVGDDHSEAILEYANGVFPGARIEMAPDLAGTPRVLCVYS